MDKFSTYIFYNNKVFSTIISTLHHLTINNHQMNYTNQNLYNSILYCPKNITQRAIDEDCKFDAVWQSWTMLVRADIPWELDVHVMESRRDAHRQSSVDNIVCDETRTVNIATIKHLQLATHFRLLVHLQHIQRNTLSKFCLKYLQPQKFVIKDIIT